MGAWVSIWRMVDGKRTRVNYYMDLIASETCKQGITQTMGFLEVIMKKVR
jgi:hypothetical protein